MDKRVVPAEAKKVMEAAISQIEAAYKMELESVVNIPMFRIKICKHCMVLSVNKSKEEKKEWEKYALRESCYSKLKIQFALLKLDYKTAEYNDFEEYVEYQIVAKKLTAD